MAFLQFGNFFQRLFSSPPQRLSSLYTLIDWKLFEHALSYKIRSKDYFVQALMHRSFIATSAGNEFQSNERLEFLGDSVLNFVVAEFLYNAYPMKEEGELTILRSKLVNKKALVYYAKEIALGEFLITNTTATGVAEKGFETILSDAYEAVIAAIFFDGGIQRAKEFVLRQVNSALEKGFLYSTEHNFKSELLELVQSQGKGIPRYSTVKEEGPDHDRTFTIEVFVGTDSYGYGVGKNKKEAEQAAAENAVQRLLHEINA